jgi:recombination protein U
MKINYPIPTENQPKPIGTNSHGMMLENALNIANEYYRIHDKAYIYKKPTPIQVVKVDYPKRSQARITEAYYRTPSTTDYNGIYRGRYLDYEAKETNNLSFAFKHIYPHQIEHLSNIDRQGGIAFVIIFYKKANAVYLIDIKTFNRLIEEGENGGRKSIPIEIAKTVGIECHQGYTPPIDYLKAVDQKFFSE